MSTQQACITHPGSGPAAAPAGSDRVRPALDAPAGVTGDAAAAASPPGADPALAEALAVVIAERDDYLDALRRLQAEFENFRNRARRERAAESERGVVRTLRHLLPRFDALDAARARHPDVIDPVRQVLDNALTGLDVQRLENVGNAFDPQLHDAVEMIEPATADRAAQGPPSSVRCCAPATAAGTTWCARRPSGSGPRRSNATTTRQKPCGEWTDAHAA